MGFFTPVQEECETLMRDSIKAGISKESIIVEMQETFPTLADKELNDLYALAKTAIMFQDKDLTFGWKESKDKKLEKMEIDKKVNKVLNAEQFPTKRRNARSGDTTEEVLALITKGYNNSKVAKELKLNMSTVSYHIKKLEQDGRLPMSYYQNKKNRIPDTITEEPVCVSKPIEIADDKEYCESENKAEEVVKVEIKASDDNIKKMASEVAELLYRKNSDYGNSFEKSLDKWGNQAFFIRIEDKINRLENLLLNGNEALVDESIDDTLKDLEGYILLFRDYRQKKKNENIDMCKKGEKHN